MKPEKCYKCSSRNMMVGQAKTISGQVVYPYFCGHCGDVTTQRASKSEVADALEKYGEIERVYTKTEERVMRGEPIALREAHGKPCEVCKSTENVEVHHWAPAHLFGRECDKWPIAYLCRPCHVRWHQIVTPDMGKRKGLHRKQMEARDAERRR